ncbi:MAG: YitT family protein [Coprobacillus sp.]
MNVKKLSTDVFFIGLGNLCIAIAVGIFVIPNKILVGGTAGVAVIINAFIAIDEELLIKILTYTLFAIGAVILGKTFIFKTIISAFLYPILLSIVGRIYEYIPLYVLEVDILIATICAGALIGLGVGLVYKRNGSTGGMDIIPLIIHKYIKIPLSTLVLIVDGLTVFLGIITYGIEASVYGVISVLVCTYVINKTMLMGTEQLKQVHIISNQRDQIMEGIFTELDRGCTVIEARGGYTNNKKDMLMVVITIKQYPSLINIVHNYDQSAFIIVSDINEVKGRGFTLKSRYL